MWQNPNSCIYPLMWDVTTTDNSEKVRKKNVIRYFHIHVFKCVWWRSPWLPVLSASSKLYMLNQALLAFFRYRQLFLNHLLLRSSSDLVTVTCSKVTVAFCWCAIVVHFYAQCHWSESWNWNRLQRATRREISKDQFTRKWKSFFILLNNWRRWGL